MADFSEFSAYKIKCLKFVEEIKVSLTYLTFTATAPQFLGTSAEAMLPVTPMSSSALSSSIIRSAMKRKMHIFDKRETRFGTVSCSNISLFLMNHPTFEKS